MITKITSQFPLFTDATVKFECETFTSSIFKKDSTRTPYDPFSGMLGCEKSEVFTGLDLCFEGSVKYLAPVCTPLKDHLELVDVEEVAAHEGNLKEVACPDGKTVIGIRLKENSNNIITYLKCAKISGDQDDTDQDTDDTDTDDKKPEPMG